MNAQLLVKHAKWYRPLLAVFIIFLGSCATPSAPPGGPPDREGPRIIRTEPETATTNFEGRSITLHFSEFVRRSSLSEAIVVEPDIGIPYDLDWGRKSVKIVFEEDLPDLTTLIVTIGTEFEDMNGNGLASPRKIAVSTGPEIDEGEIYGEVINAQTGEGTEEQRVLLYREPFDLQEKASYIASTDTSGAFQFSYLREGRYKIFWVDDRNRNKVWEQEQERAQPFGRETIELAKAGSDTAGTVFVTTVDTTQPTLQGVGLFSSRRMRMRFSENIRLTDSTDIAVTDTVGNSFSGVVPLFIQPDDPYILFSHSDKPLSPASNYRLDIRGITDESGNAISEATQTFTGSAQEDTTLQRIVKGEQSSGYFPGDPLEIIYAKPITEPEIRDSLKIVEGDTLLEDWQNVEIDQNVLRISPANRWKEGIAYEIRVWDPRMQDYQKIKPQIWYESQMGALNVIMADSTAKNIRLTVENDESGIRRDTSFSGQVEMEKLPPLDYRVTVYQDENDNGEWDFGQVLPFVKPEPYFMQRQVPVKKGLTGELTVEFQK